MAILQETYKLYNGVEIPKIGFGTWQIPQSKAEESVLYALESGYIHIDTALAYNNENGVGSGIKKSGLSREDVFITTKLPAEIKGYDRAMESFEKSLVNLGVDYIDLYLIHAPWPWTAIGKDCTAENISSWKAFEELYKAKKIRSIGVSNFSPKDIDALIDNCEILPMVNQIAFYAGRTQKEYVDYCNTKGILVEAYSPLATGRALNDPLLKNMANKYSVTVAQLLIRFTLQRDTLPLPKSTNRERIVENTKIEHFSIDQSDMDILNSLKTEYR